MASYYNNVDLYVDRVLGREARKERSGNIFSQGDKIYSYGHHFELGRLLRGKKGEPRLFLLNGDRYSVTTGRHQSELRSAVERSGVPSVIIPFETLDAAGINYDDVELVHATADTHETKEHRSYVEPAGSVWRDVPIRKSIPYTEAEIEAYVAKENADALKSYEDRIKWAQENPDGYYAKYPPKEPKVLTVEEVKGPTYSPLVHYNVVVGHERRLYHGRSTSDTIDVSTEADTGRTLYTWTTYRHWLGESVIRAKLTTDFWAKCPNCKVKDQGCGICYGRRQVRRSQTRTAYLLSGFDHQEFPRRVYFLCELPKGAKPTTVAEAYEALKPDVVKMAEQMGRTVRRQGDIFAIELRDTTKKRLWKQGARFERRGNLFGTNHEATETAYLPDGTTLVQGLLYHNPDGRDPDHRRVKVGEHWHIVVKNTVPVTK